MIAELFLTFAKIGLFTFGGGYAMISLIRSECVEKKQWITPDEMINVTVVAETTPGPIAINCATYVGYRQKGMAGAVAATVGMVLPSFVIILAVSGFLDHYLDTPLVASAFRGIRIAVGILILDAGIKMVGNMQKKPLPRIIMACAFVAMMAVNLFALRISSVTLMLVFGAVSTAMYALKRPGEKEGAGR